MNTNRRVTWRASLWGIAAALAVVACVAYWGFHAQPAMALPDDQGVDAVKSVVPDSTGPGATVKYSFHITNTTGSAQQIDIADHLSADLGAVSNMTVSPLGTGFGYDISTPGYVTVTLYNLANGASAVVSFDVVVDAGLETGTVIPNQATISFDTHSFQTNVANLTVVSHIVYFPVVVKWYPAIPHAPVLTTTATSPDPDGDFVMNWTYSYPLIPVGFYELQQASDAAFSSPLVYYTGSTMYKIFENMTGGIYYYRVRGVNGWGNGDWSNVVTVVVESGDVYLFDTAGNLEGWAIVRTDDDDLLPPYVRDGVLYQRIEGSYDFSIYSPRNAAPSLPYNVKARVDIIDNQYIIGDEEYPYTPKSEMAYGIIFAASAGTPCPADRTTPDGSGCFEHYYRLLVVPDPSYGMFKWNLKRIDGHNPADGGEGYGVEVIGYTSTRPSGGIYGWNDWTIYVSADATNNIKVYLNGALVGMGTDHNYLNEPYYGTFLDTGVHGSVATKYDWFKVEK